MSTVRKELTTLASLAWPVILGQLAMMSMSVVDAIMVGRLDAVQMAAVAVGTTWVFGVVILALGTLQSLDPVLSQAHGAGDTAAAGRGLRHGLALVAGMAPAVVGLMWLAPWGLKALGQPAEIIPAGAAYAQIASLSAPAMLSFSLVRMFLQSRGEMRAATTAILLANVANAALDYAFIFGRWGAPALGAVGAAVATATCQYVQLGLLLFLARGSLGAAWRAGASKVSPWRVLDLGRRGLPMGFQLGTEVWAFQLVGFLAGQLGTMSLAAHGVVLNLSSLSFMLPLGVSTAAATRVGNLIGGGQRWGKTVKAALLLGVGTMTLSAFSFAFLPTALAGVYTNQAEIIVLAATILPIAAAFQLVDGTQVVCFGLLRGAGDTRLGAFANLAGYWLIGLPFGAWLAFGQGLGVRGLWMGLAVALAVVAVILLFRLRATHRRGGYRVGLATTDAVSGAPGGG